MSIIEKMFEEKVLFHTVFLDISQALDPVLNEKLYIQNGQTLETNLDFWNLVDHHFRLTLKSAESTLYISKNQTR